MFLKLAFSIHRICGRGLFSLADVNRPLELPVEPEAIALPNVYRIKSC